jgi:hypothetical protein
MGWQFSEDEWSAENGNFTHTENEYDQYLVRVHALRRRKVEDTVDTLNGIDIVKKLRLFFGSSAGRKQINALGYSVLATSPVAEPQITDEGDNYEILPFFEQTWITLNTEKSTTPKIDEYRFKSAKV